MFNLRKVAYIRWGGRETLYAVTEFQSTTGDVAAPYEHPIVRERRMRDEKAAPAPLVEKKTVVVAPKATEAVVGVDTTVGVVTAVASDDDLSSLISDLPPLLSRMTTGGFSKAWGDM
jgi:hypothetical protein